MRKASASQFVKTVGLEDIFGFAEMRISNFWASKNCVIKHISEQSDTQPTSVPDAFCVSQDFPTG